MKMKAATVHLYVTGNGGIVIVDTHTHKTLLEGVKLNSVVAIPGDSITINTVDYVVCRTVGMCRNINGYHTCIRVTPRIP